MNKQEFIKKLALVQGVSQSKAEDILTDVKRVISEEITAGNDVSLGQDFGTFKPVTRTGTVPGTTNKYSSNSVKFSISAPFKRELNK